MPSWVVKLIQSLAVPILEWAAGVVKDIYAAYKEKKEEKQKEVQSSLCGKKESLQLAIVQM